MSNQEFDVTGIGNAIVDVLTHVDDAFLETEKLPKGGMQLIDEAQAEALYSRMPAGVECSGGSAGNTMAGIASLGGTGNYVGKVAQDQLGEVFAHDMRSGGMHFETASSTSGTPTARCLVLVTDDAQRTMNTFLGACVELSADDINEAVIKASKVTYMEGYLWDPPAAKEAFLKAARIAHDAGRKVSLSLSDQFCVDRHRAEFLDLVDNHVDILFANESEIMSLYQVDNFDDAVAAVRGKCELAALTRSEQGSYIVTNGDVFHAAADKVDRVVDTTGAGDLYAAGFLYGYTHGRAPLECGQLGAICAGEVISHYGARPETSLAELIKAKGL